MIRLAGRARRAGHGSLAHLRRRKRARGVTTIQPKVRDRPGRASSIGCLRSIHMRDQEPL